MKAPSSGPLSGPLRRLGISHTAFSVTVITFGSNLLISVYNFYYLKVFLNVYHISEWWFQLAQVLFMIWNALNDPLFGYWQDVGGCGYGWMRNRRLSILYLCPLWALSSLLPWFPWTYAGAPDWLVGVHLIVSLFFWDGFFSFVLLAWSALFAETTTDATERVRLIKYNQIATLLGVNAIVIVEKVSGSMQDMVSFRIATCCLACIATVAFMYTGLYAPDTAAQVDSFSDRAQQASAREAAKSGDNKWQQSLTFTWQVLCEPSFHRVTWTNFLHTVRSTTHSNFAAIFMEGLVPRTVMPLGSWHISGFYWLASVLPQLFVIGSSGVVERWGVTRFFKGALVGSIILALTMWTVGRHQPHVLLAFWLLDSILLHAMSPMFNILFPGLIDEDMIRHQRSEPLSSVIFSLNALIVKPAQSVAPMLVVWWMDRFGYDTYKRAQRSGGGSSSVAAAFTDTHDTDYEQLRDGMFSIMLTLTVVVASCQYLIIRRHSTVKQPKRSLDAKDDLDVESRAQLIAATFQT